MIRAYFVNRHVVGSQAQRIGLRLLATDQSTAPVPGSKTEKPKPAPTKKVPKSLLTPDKKPLARSKVHPWKPKVHGDDLEVARALRKAESPHEILAIVEEEGPDMTLVNVCTAMKSVVNLTSGINVRKRDPVEKSRVVNMVKLAQEKFLADKEMRDPRTLASLAWGVSKLDVDARLLFEELTRRSFQAVEEFNTKDISQLIYGFSRAAIYRSALFNEFVPIILRKLPGFRPEELSNLLISYASTKHQSPVLYTLLAKELAYRGNQCNAQVIANTVYSLAKSGAEDTAPLLELAPLAARSMGKKEMTAQGVALTLWSYAKAEVWHDKVFMSGVKSLRDRHLFSRATPQNLANCLTSLVNYLHHHVNSPFGTFSADTKRPSEPPLQPKALSRALEWIRGKEEDPGGRLPYSSPQVQSFLEEIFLGKSPTPESLGLEPIAPQPAAEVKYSSWPNPRVIQGVQEGVKRLLAYLNTSLEQEEEFQTALTTARGNDGEDEESAVLLEGPEAHQPKSSKGKKKAAMVAKPGVLILPSGRAIPARSSEAQTAVRVALTAGELVDPSLHKWTEYQKPSGEDKIKAEKMLNKRYRFQLIDVADCSSAMMTLKETLQTLTELQAGEEEAIGKLWKQYLRAVNERNDGAESSKPSGLGEKIDNVPSPVRFQTKGELREAVVAALAGSVLAFPEVPANQLGAHLVPLMMEGLSEEESAKILGTALAHLPATTTARQRLPVYLYAADSDYVVRRILGRMKAPLLSQLLQSVSSTIPRAGGAFSAVVPDLAASSPVPFIDTLDLTSIRRLVVLLGNGLAKRRSELRVEALYSGFVPSMYLPITHSSKSLPAVVASLIDHPFSVPKLSHLLAAMSASGLTSKDMQPLSGGGKSHGNWERHVAAWDEERLYERCWKSLSESLRLSGSPTALSSLPEEVGSVKDTQRRELAVMGAWGMCIGGATDLVLKEAGHDLAAYLREAQLELWDASPPTQAALFMTCLHLRSLASGSLRSELDDAVGGSFQAQQHFERLQRASAAADRDQSTVMRDVARGLEALDTHVIPKQEFFKDTHILVNGRGRQTTPNGKVVDMLYIIPSRSGIHPRWSTSPKDPWSLQGWNPGAPTLLHPFEAARLALLAQEHSLDTVKVISSADWLEVIAQDPERCAEYLKTLAKPRLSKV